MAAYLRKQLCCLLFLGNTTLDPDWFPIKLMGAGLLVIAQQVTLTWSTFGSVLRDWLLGGPILIVLCLWSLDMLAGSGLALARRNWSPRKGFYGVVKLLIWVSALSVAWLLRVDGYPLDDFFAPVVELAIILTEASSVLRNLASLMEIGTGKKSRVLAWFSDRVDQTQEVLLSRVQVVQAVQVAQAKAQAAQARAAHDTAERQEQGIHDLQALVVEGAQKAEAAFAEANTVNEKILNQGLLTEHLQEQLDRRESEDKPHG